MYQDLSIYKGEEEEVLIDIVVVVVVVILLFKKYSIIKKIERGADHCTRDD